MTCYAQNKWYAQKGYPKKSAAEATRAQVWDRWDEGLSHAEIARTLNMRHEGVNAIIAACGGIRPAQRCRSPRVLSTAEREEISRGLEAGCSMREIARHLRRAPSSISREVRRTAASGSIERSMRMSAPGGVLVGRSGACSPQMSGCGSW